MTHFLIYGSNNSFSMWIVVVETGSMSRGYSTPKEHVDIGPEHFDIGLVRICEYV